jgi:hypothetical protein
MSPYVKYPRTFHLPWSESYTRDDKFLSTVSYFNKKEVVVTEKMDGENTTCYQDHIHARSLDSKDHPSRHWMKSFHSSFAHTIPKGWRVCGENVFAKHSIFYNSLPSYFLVFSVWDEKNECLSWTDTISFCNDRGLLTVPVLYWDIWDENHICSLYTKKSTFGGDQEGYVVRLAKSFSYEEFEISVGKFVRKNHIQTDKHWLNQAIVSNRLKILTEEKRF